MAVGANQTPMDADGKVIMQADGKEGIGPECCCDCGYPCTYCGYCPPKVVRVTISNIEMQTACMAIYNCSNVLQGYLKVVGSKLSAGNFSGTFDLEQQDECPCNWSKSVEYTYATLATQGGVSDCEADPIALVVTLLVQRTRRDSGNGWMLTVYGGPVALTARDIYFCGFIEDDIEDDCQGSRVADNSITAFASPVLDACYKSIFNEDPPACFFTACYYAALGKNGTATITPL